VLALTQDAVSAVHTIISSSELPEGSGLRISRVPAGSENSSEPELALQLNLVDAPEEGDQVIGDEAVFVESAAADALDDKVLDAEVVENQVRFVVAPQPD
jgi:iron-sulfur cluster assembly protein